MIRCPLYPPAATVCAEVGALHKLNGTCQCAVAGEEHTEHWAPCGTAWKTGATVSQIKALRIIAAQPGLTARAFHKYRDSSGYPFRVFSRPGWISITKGKRDQVGNHGQTATITVAGLELLEQFSVDRRAAGLR